MGAKASSVFSAHLVMFAQTRSLVFVAATSTYWPSKPMIENRGELVPGKSTLGQAGAHGVGCARGGLEDILAVQVASRARFADSVRGLCWLESLECSTSASRRYNRTGDSFFVKELAFQCAGCSNTCCAGSIQARNLVERAVSVRAAACDRHAATTKRLQDGRKGAFKRKRLSGTLEVAAGKEPRKRAARITAHHNYRHSHICKSKL